MTPNTKDVIIEVVKVILILVTGITVIFGLIILTQPEIWEKTKMRIGTVTPYGDEK